MAKTVELIQKSVLKNILKSDDVLDYLEDMANGFAASCGEGYAVSRYNGGKARGNVSVYANTDEAYKDNLENNTLLKVTGA